MSADNFRITEEDEDYEHIIIPEEAIKHLPPEWQEQLNKLKEEGREALASVDSNLRSLNRLVHAFPVMASLRYIYSRLASTKFEPTMEWVLENDMLVLAFVTTYCRLVEGGIGSGVARDQLPTDLRNVHDEIKELRNKRYAHNDGHQSVEGQMEIGFEDDKFDLKINVKMGFHVGGPNEWGPLVDFLDALMFDRLYKQLDKLAEKTGKKWTFPSGPPPSWVDSD